MIKRPTRSFSRSASKMGPMINTAAIWTTRSRRKNGSATATFVAAASCLLLLTAAYMWLLGFGLSPSSAPIGGAFSLTQDGGRVVTERDFRGHYVLIYFGYTECADVCPMTLTAIADAIDILGSRASNLRPVFISVDPKRDSPAVVRAYAEKFSPNILGLTGTPDQISAIERAFKVSSKEMPTKDDNAMDYVVDHTAALFLIGPDGRYMAPLAAMQAGPDLARELAQYLRSGPGKARSTVSDAPGRSGTWSPIDCYGHAAPINRHRVDAADYNPYPNMFLFDEPPRKPETGPWRGRCQFPCFRLRLSAISWAWTYPCRGPHRRSVDVLRRRPSRPAHARLSGTRARMSA